MLAQAYWAADGVRVNCLSPGPFPAEGAPADMVGRLETKLPMGRMGARTQTPRPSLPAKAGRTLAFLLSSTAIQGCPLLFVLSF